ncbi:hypothetical protein FDP41_008651 [Naegleria fowleri]|uniref:Cytochrome P450 n=1 Tax=Naegleria fowleri TaxID=5763 RepID=A0A6A5B4Z3_NAEFO|nr:uncharacterized protein FDP41_008651 [Naegleria fowleri]KAF0972987.1 hypothetical protein FDP41_008651 [Naegleria fowleri]CAG4717001.1 unnamed protein product [Naegleria fowleri]
MTRRTLIKLLSNNNNNKHHQYSQPQQQTYSPLLYTRPSLNHLQLFNFDPQRRLFHTHVTTLEVSSSSSSSAAAQCPFHASSSVASTTSPILSSSAAVIASEQVSETLKGESPNKTNPVKSFEEIPGPKAWPLVGNLFDLLQHKGIPNIYFYDLCEKYGDMVRLKIPFNNMLIVSHPTIIEELVKKEERREFLKSNRFYKQQHDITLAPIEMTFFEDWQEIRNLYNVAMKPENLEKVSLPQITQLNGDFLRTVVSKLKKVQNNHEFTKYHLPNAFDVTSLYTFKAVAKTFLGVKVTEQVEKQLPWTIYEFVEQAVRATDIALQLDNKPPLYQYFKTREYKEMESLMDNIYDGCKKLISMFKENPNPQIPRLKELVDERASGMENAEKKSEGVLSAFLNGGVDITSRIMVNQMYRLAHHVEYQDKLFEELKELFGEPTSEEFESENGLQITWDKYKKMKLVKNFLEETMRLNSFSYLTSGRWLLNDIELNGYLVPKDTRIFIMNYHPSLKDEFVPRAREFIPERHEKGHPLAPKSMYSSLPFGIGARKCPGSRIASTELHMSLINLVRHFKLTHENPDKFPESSHDQSMLYIDSKKNPLYLIPRDHMKPILEKHVMI